MTTTQKKSQSLHISSHLLFLTALFFCSFFLEASASFANESIKIAMNFELSGPAAPLSAKAKNGVNMVVETVNLAGGLEIGGKKYDIEIMEFDNGNDKTVASRMTLQAIQKDKILAIIPPLASDMAIQVAQIANALNTPLVAANSTSPKITKGRPYAFKTSANYEEMAKATIKIASEQWNAKKMAVLYDSRSSYSSDMAKTMKAAFIEAKGEGSVPAFELYDNGLADIDRQLATIIASGADFLYLPLYELDVANVIRKIKAMGWNKPVTGPDSWGFEELLKECGSSYCNGTYFTGNFVVKGAEGTMQNFIDLYQARYNAVPDEGAASGYDAMSVIVQGLQKLDSITGDIRIDRENLRDAIAAVNFDGATAGTCSYSREGDNSGEPEKCVVMIKIVDGEFVKEFIDCP